MLKRMTLIASLIALSAGLSGCSKCGFWWDDAPRSCRDSAKPS